MLINNVEFSNEAVVNNLKRITNQIYKLLPNREENIDWKTPLKTIIEELSGMNRLVTIEYQELLCSLLCKLEGLYLLEGEENFYEYRRTIFDCLNIIQNLKTKVQEG